MIPPLAAVRFDPRRHRAHVESYFLKLNDGASRRALWLKATILARPGEPPVAESWAIAFDREKGHRAAKATVLFEEARFGRGEALDVAVGGLSLSSNGTSGSVGGGSTEIGWSLAFSCDVAPLRLYPFERMYTGGFPRSKLVSPLPDAVFDGHYVVDGERVDVSRWRGMLGHNWGDSHAHRYAWGHAAGFEGEPDAFFEGVTARVRVGPILSPPLTVLCLALRGRRMLFNRPLDLARNRGAMDVRRWEVSASNDLGTLTGDLAATNDEMVGLRYENPTGDPCFCLNAKIATARLRFTPRGRKAIELRSRESALEIGTTDPSHGVRVYV